jgi:DNA-binding response OmpR family regulator
MTVTVPRTSATTIPADQGSIVLVDPLLEGPDDLIRQMLTLGVELRAYREPLRALAHLAATGGDVLVLAAGLGPETLAQVVEVAREELGVPVLLALEGADVDAIGPAVLAGARPLVFQPYDAAALLAALRQVSPVPPPPPQVEVGPLSVDPSGGSARIGGRGVDLSHLELGVLYELAAHHDAVVTRQTLIARYCRRSTDPDSALVSAVGRLRRKLAPFGVAGAVHTVRGFGYRLDTEALTYAFSAPNT